MPRDEFEYHEPDLNTTLGVGIPRDGFKYHETDLNTTKDGFKHEGGKVVSPTYRPPLPPGIFSGTQTIGTNTKFLNQEDGADRFSRNVGVKLPLLVA